MCCMLIFIHTYILIHMAVCKKSAGVTECAACTGDLAPQCPDPLSALSAGCKKVFMCLYMDGCVCLCVCVPCSSVCTECRLQEGVYVYVYEDVCVCVNVCVCVHGIYIYLYILYMFVCALILCVP